MNKKNIALLAGGYSGEYVVSVQSAATIENNIDKALYNIYKILITRDGWYHDAARGERIAVDKNDFSLTIDNEKVLFDAVFIGIHGTPGEDGKLQGYLDMLKIPYTGCGAISSALTFNKSYCNKVVAALDIVHVSRSAHLFKDQDYQEDVVLSQLKFPVFVKPNEGGSSIGMSKVSRPEDLDIAIKKAFREDTQVLVEEFIKGREITCGLFKTKDTIHVLPLTEIKSNTEFFDFEAKYTPGKSQEITPAETGAVLREEITLAAKRLYAALNCHGLVRVDFIVEEDTGKLFFLEVNTMPGQSENSLVPQQVRAEGGTLRDFYGALIEDCLRQGKS